VADRLADLAVAERDYVDQAPSFSPTARQAAHALLRAMRPKVASMSDAQFALALMQVPALADNGHDATDFGDEAWFPKRRLPVRMIWFPDALIIARAAPELSDLLGSSVLEIERLSPPDLLTRIRRLQGGTDEYRRWQLNWVFHSAEALHALGIAKSADRLTMRLRLRDGRVIRRTLQTRPVDQVPAGQQPQRYWIPAQWQGEREMGWRAAVDANKAPTYLQQPDQWYRMIDIPELEALYLQFRSNFDEGDAKIGTFVESVMRRLKSSAPQNAIVDLRFDTGGDNTQNRALMRELALTVPAKIYLLVGNYTFSAGIATAAALLHDGGDKVTVVGSEIADRTYWWSEHAKPVCLPTSKLCFPINTGYWDIVNGCQGNSACYGDQFDLRVRSLAPRLRQPLNSVDWLANRDPAMEAIAADLHPLR
jgi:hypothetical protein